MRTLRYFTFLVLALLSLNVVAQNLDSTRVKITVIFELGVYATEQQYDEAISQTRLFTFSPKHNAREAYRTLEDKGFSVRFSGGTFLEEIELVDVQRVQLKKSDYLQKEKYADQNDTLSTVLGRKAEFTLKVPSDAASFIVYCDYDALPPLNFDGTPFKKGLLSNSPVLQLHIETELTPDAEKVSLTDDIVIDAKPAERPGVLIMNKSFAFPYKIKPNQRIIAQPVWYDRVDISDANSDTVFAYGKPVYLDYTEYALTQDRAMDYRMKHDELFAYTDTVKYHKDPKLNIQRFDSLWVLVCDRLRTATVVPNEKDELLCVFPGDKKKFSRDAWVKLLDNKTSSDSLKAIYKAYLFSHDAPSSITLAGHLTDSIRTSISLSEGLDTIYVHAYEELRGHDRNTAHPYPQGLQLYIEDYNRVLHEMRQKDGGERKNPFKFLDFTFKEFLPDAEEFHLIMRNEEFHDSTEVRLQFEWNSPNLIPNDSLNEVELARLDSIFIAYNQDRERKNLTGVHIIAYSSPEGNVEGNKDLARRRAMTAKGRINTTATVTISSDVAPWDSVVSLLRRDGKDDVAEYIQSVIDRNPGKLQVQSYEIQKSDYYTTEFKETYLPPLRTVKFRLNGRNIGQLPDHMIIERFRDGEIGNFGRPEYWVLLNKLTDPKEHQQAAKLAYEKTCSPGIYNKYHKGYWAYAAAHYAAASITNGVYDHSILAPFLDMENALITVEKDTFEITEGVEDVSIYDIRREEFATLFVPDGADVYKAVLEISGSANKEKDTLRISSADYKKAVDLINKTDKDAIHGLKIALLDGDNETLFFENLKTLSLTRNYKTPDKVTEFKKGQRKLNSRKEHKGSNHKDNELYLNQIDMVANQLIMTLKSPDPYWSEYLYELVEILKGQMKKYEAVITRRGEKPDYDRLLAVANCYTGNYAGSDPESVRLREIVASTSTKNKVVINIAMHDPQIKGGKELETAYKASKELPDTCSESNYLRAIVLMRKYEEDKDKFPIKLAYDALKKAFLGDMRMIYTSSNDQDFMSRVPGVDMVNEGLMLWEKEMSKATDSVDIALLTLDEIAFRNYKEAIYEPDTLKARLSMYKAFLLNENYYNVVAVRMKGIQKKNLIKEDADNVLLFDKLKAIRRSYSEAAEGKGSDATYMQAQQEVKALRKNKK